MTQEDVWDAQEAACVSDDQWNANWNDDWKWCEWSMKPALNLMKKSGKKTKEENHGAQIAAGVGIGAVALLAGYAYCNRRKNVDDDYIRF